MKQWGSETIIEIEDVIKPEKISVYKAELNVIRNELSIIANNLVIMERLIEFPYDLFISNDHRLFWSMTIKAFFDSTVIAFSKILDKGNRSLSLYKFQNNILDSKKYRLDKIDDEVLKILNQRIDDIKFDKQIEPLQKQIKLVRNNHVAHLDSKKAFAPSEIIAYMIPLDVFKKALELLDQLFQVMGLGVWYQLPYWEYGNSDQKLDIDEIFELIVKQSYWFSENSSIDFQESYEKLSDKDKVILDEWRERVQK